MAYTLDDFVKLNPNYSKRYDAATKTAYVKNGISGKEIGFQTGQGKEYGMGGIQNGSNIVSDVGKLTGTLGNTEFKSPYSEERNKTLDSIKNRGPFSYNSGADAGLQNAQNNAIDTTSRAAARKGMLYSDSNKAAMNKAALDLVPQFEQAAFNKYQAEGTDLYNKLSSLESLDNNAYNRFNSDRTFTAGRDAANQSQLNWYKTFGENQRQFDVGQQNWQKEMTFKEKEAQIQNALSKGQLSVSQGQLILSKAKWDVENDPDSLNNRIRRAQLRGATASAAKTEAETNNISNGLTPSGGTPSGTQPTESEAKRAEEVKLQTKLDSLISNDTKGIQTAESIKAQQDWIKANKSNIIGSFGRDYYTKLASEYSIY